MAATEVNGNHEAMSAIAPQITAPPMPPSMARLATPPNLTGLPEGIAMSLLDKAATGVLTAFIGKITQDLVTFSTNAKAVAVTYSAADVGSAFDLAAAAAKLGTQGIGLLKKAQSIGTSTGTSTATSAGSAPQTTV